MQNVGALDADNASLNAKRGQQDIGAVVLDYFAHLVQSLEQDGVKLGVGYHDGLDEDLGGHDKIMQTGLGTKNRLGVLSSDVDEVIGPSLGTWRRVSEEPRK